MAADEDHYPQRLDELVNEKYLRHLPVDPISKRANWQAIYISMDGEQVVYDVKKCSRGGGG